jgi:hypothetical protein
MQQLQQQQQQHQQQLQQRDFHHAEAVAALLQQLELQKQHAADAAAAAEATTATAKREADAMQAQITHLQQRSSSAAAEVVSCEQQVRSRISHSYENSAYKYCHMSFACQASLSAVVALHCSEAENAIKQREQLQLQLDRALESVVQSSQTLSDTENRHQQLQLQLQQLQHERLLERKMLLDEIHNIKSADDAGDDIMSVLLCCESTSHIFQQ